MAKLTARVTRILEEYILTLEDDKTRYIDSLILQNKDPRYIEQEEINYECYIDELVEIKSKEYKTVEQILEDYREELIQEKNEYISNLLIDCVDNSTIDAEIERWDYHIADLVDIKRQELEANLPSNDFPF